MPRVRAGFLVPSVNVVLETDFATLVPPPVSAHVARVKWRPEQSSEELREVRRVAAEQIADARPSAVGFACSAETMVSTEETEAVLAQFGDLIPAPVVPAGSALVERLRADGAWRLAVLTPLAQAAADRELAFLDASGFKIATATVLGVDDPALVSDVPPEEIADLVASWEGQPIDAAVILCATFRGVQAAALVSDRLSVPVFAINAVLIEATLKLCDERANGRRT